MKKSGGYPLPEVIPEAGELCVSFRIPDIDEVKRAVIGHIWELGTWIVWDKSKDPTDFRARTMAEIFRTKLYHTLKIEECEEMCCCKTTDRLLIRLNAQIGLSTNATALEGYGGLLSAYQESTNPVQDFAPSLATPSDTGDKAYCEAVRNMIDIACEYAIEERERDSLLLSTAVLALGIASAIVTAGSSLAISLALSASLTGSGIIFQGLAIEVLEDMNARHELKCLMLSRLKGQTPTKTRFEDSLNPIAGLSTNAELIRTAIDEIITNEGMHATFLELLEDSYRVAQLGLVQDCGCFQPDPLWVIGGGATIINETASQLVIQSSNSFFSLYRSNGQRFTVNSFTATEKISGSGWQSCFDMYNPVAPNAGNFVSCPDPVIGTPASYPSLPAYPVEGISGNYNGAVVVYVLQFTLEA